MEDFVMKSVVNAIQKFVKEDHGATAVEYGVLVALIIAVLIATIKAVGGKLSTSFQTVNANLT